LDVIDQLLSAATPVDGVDADGSTVLHEAAYSGRADSVRHLLAHGADPGRRDTRFGGTPLGWCRHRRHETGPVNGHGYGEQLLAQRAPTGIPWPQNIVALSGGIVRHVVGRFMRIDHRDSPAEGPRDSSVTDGPAVRRVAELYAQGVERQEWLNKPGYKLEHGMAFVFGLVGARARPLQDLLHGVWLGHPLHPVITDIPVGAWTAALVLDTVDMIAPRPAGFRQAAQMSVGLGVVGGIGGALTGLTDWQHTHDDARRAGMLHGALNAVALSLYGLSWRDRRRGRHVRARITSTLGYGLTIASSYLGGRLVFRHRVGVDHVDGRLTPREFVPVLTETELAEDSPTAVDCSGVPVVLIRHEGRISAFGGQCPHLGASMAEGWLYRDQFVCPWHGSRFDLQTGAATSGPATSPLSSFQTRLRDGQIEIRRIPPAQLATTGQTAITEGAQRHES